MRVLTGDIGGTNTRLALVKFEGNTAHIEHQARFFSPSFPSLNDIVKLFQSQSGDSQAAAAADGG